jgi:hypothetical protein
LKVRAALRRAIEGVYCLFVRRDSLKLAAVRVQFRNTDHHRDYLTVYQPPRSNGAKRGTGNLRVCSFAEAGAPDELDLRNSDDAVALEMVLSKIDPASLVG